jgi:hypothetical protein
MSASVGAARTPLPNRSISFADITQREGWHISQRYFAVKHGSIDDDGRYGSMGPI